ncbi:hypothetical protein CIG75_04980 [Tumebacillus algifaecis]|uniref:Carrier domain-containing protein n=1 Tax=Tumebacillus algifaecis TaxID=1214604 RepID=A0A223CYJ5_9BACL|nr:non-ribosomal peptide synthetase [Tumebacillus algifaecis]ASS74401.1 hypothetical protein CIG75_04980 [Tumebacillus algifaecis]
MLIQNAAKRQVTEIPLLTLPVDRPRPATVVFREAEARFVLPDQCVQALTEVGAREGVSLSVLLLVAFQSLLARYSGQEELGIGLVDESGLVRLLCSDLSPLQTFAELTRAVQEQVASIEREAVLTDDSALQVLYAFECALPKAREYDVALIIRQEADGLLLKFSYNAELYDLATIERMGGHLQELLQSALQSGAQPLIALALITEAERKLLLESWTAGPTAPLDHEMIDKMFEAQVQKTPDRIALRFEGESVTYAELNRRANQLARALRAKGVQPEQLIGLCVDRSVEMVIGMFGILKAGAAYLPLDPAYPTERLTFMVEDAGVQVLLTKTHVLQKIELSVATTICLDSDWPEIAKESEDNPDFAVQPDNLAYVIYTSGTTGRPKGVMIENRNVCNMSMAITERFQIDEDTIMLQFAAFSFDSSVAELFPALMNGGTVLLAPKDKVMPGPGLVELLTREQVTHVILPPSVLALLPEDQLKHLKVVVSAGEACAAELVRKWSATGRHFVNGYGPTEGTVGALIGICLPGEAVNVGRPMQNTTVYLLDANLQPVPVGVPGEICIGGAGLARGYLGRPDLTSEKFIDNPFEDATVPRLYKTGDLGCYLPDGRVRYISRIDNQVKIRGFRIELDEVESALLTHPDVQNASVIDREDTPGVKRLAGYVVPKEGRALSVRELRRYLAERLPDFMVPTAFALLEALPLTQNGKVDRRALPVPNTADRALYDEAYVAPATPDEMMLAQIYSEVLGVEQVGVHDHFFELGGESLLATKVVARVRELFGVELPLNTLFAKPTLIELVAELARMQRETTETLAPLTKRPRRERMPLSYAQERIWFLRELFPDNLSYSASCLLTFKGPFDVEIMERTLNEILRRHDIFSTTFQSVHGEPAQVVEPFEPIKLRVVDLHQLSETEKQAEMDKIVEVEIKKQFKLDELPMVRWTLFKLEQDVHTLLHVEDHLVHDGFSFSVFLYDFLHIYNAYVEGNQSPLPDPEIQFVDFADWQREMMDGPEGDRQLAYWKDKLTGAPGILELPLDHPRPAVQRFKGAAFRFQIPYQVSKGIREFSRKNGVSLFMTLMAAYNVLLYRYSGQEDILVGTGIANRRLKETERLIGMIVNNVLFRTQLGGNPTFKEIVEQVRQTSMEAYEHQDVPFERVIAALGIERDLNRNPLMQVMFSMHDTPMPEIEIPGVEMFIHEGLNNGSAKFDMNIMVIPRHSKRLGVRGKGDSKDEGITVNWEFNTDLWDADTIDRMIQNWIGLLADVIDHPDARIGELSLLSREEEQKLLVAWNDTEADYPTERCLHELFEEQVQKSPDHIAVVYGEQTLTYAELDRQANRLAHHLRALGVGPDVPVGVSLERCPELVVVLLGVLKAGGAYLPLDTDAPPARKAQVLEDAQAPVCISQAHLTDRLPQGAVKYVFVDRDAAEIAKHPETKPETDLLPHHLVSIYYTSGSTGKPKGVCSTHDGWVNRMNWMQRRYNLQATETVLQKTTLTFDDAAVEFFWPLMVGARIAMLEPELHKDPLAIMEAAIRYETAVLQFVPSMLSLFLDAVTAEKQEQLRALRIVISSGEALRADLVRSFLHNLPSAGLFNQWGATEVSIDSTCHEVTAADANEEGIVSVGRPIDNNQVYILDGNLNPIPIGVPGDLYLAGVGLARGYLNNPERTAEAFIPHPFAPGEVMYKTGDRGYYRKDGSIMFLGRRDDQVKVRGQRVELAEIEAVLVTHPALKECAVVAHKRPSGYYIVGYYELEAGQNVTVESLREHLLALLPEYMVPARFVLMDALPLTVSGKLDRKLLPDPGEERPDLEAAFIAPRNEIERTIANIWQEILRLNEVGVYDKFFDLGGHSLDATRIMSRINRELGTSLPLRDLFECLTVAGLAERVADVRSSDAKGQLKPVRHAATRDRYELSNAQKRFWFEFIMHPESAIGSMMVSELRGQVNVAAFQQAYAQLVQRHSIMRTTFFEADGVPYQVVRDDLEMACKFEDLSHHSEAEQQTRIAEHLARVYSTPYDLINGPLFYSALLKLTDNKALWVRSTHAIVYDGWSSIVYMNDFAALYQAAVAGQEGSLPEALQYVDYAEWQAHSLKDGDMDDQKAYWLERLADVGAPPPLPYDYDLDEVERPEPMSLRLTTVDAQLTEAVRQLALQQGTTTFLAVTAAFNIWLSRVSGQTDVVVGSPLTGRTNPELEPVIGVLVNPAAFRTDLSGNPTAMQVIERIKTVAFGAYANQDYPYDLLVQDLRAHRSTNDPLYSIVLVGQNVHTGGFKLHDDLHAVGFEYEAVIADQVSMEVERSPFDLHIEVFEKGDHLWIRTHYDAFRFQKDTVDRLLAQFVYVLEQFVEEPEKRLQQFALERLEDTLDDLF